MNYLIVYIPFIMHLISWKWMPKSCYRGILPPMTCATRNFAPRNLPKFKLLKLYFRHCNAVMSSFSVSNR